MYTNGSWASPYPCDRCSDATPEPLYGLKLGGGYLLRAHDWVPFWELPCTHRSHCAQRYAPSWEAASIWRLVDVRAQRPGPLFSTLGCAVGPSYSRASHQISLSISCECTAVQLLHLPNPASSTPSQGLISTALPSEPAPKPPFESISCRTQSRLSPSEEAKPKEGFKKNHLHSLAFCKEAN